MIILLFMYKILITIIIKIKKDISLKTIFFFSLHYESNIDNIVMILLIGILIIFLSFQYFIINM